MEWVSVYEVREVVGMGERQWNRDTEGEARWCGNGHRRQCLHAMEECRHLYTRYLNNALN